MMDIVVYFKFLTGYDATEDQKKVLVDLVDLGIKKILISAGRQSGKTLCTAVAILWFIFEYPTPLKILLVSAQENALYFHIREIFKKHGEFEKEIVAQGTYSLVPLHGFETHKGSIVYVRGSTDKQIRGLPADIVFVDEAAEIKNDIILTAMGNLSGAISKFGLLSTPHIATSLFVKWATDDDSGFKVHQWSSEGLSWHDPTIQETKKKEFSPQKYAVEVLGRPPTSEERAFFNTKDIDKCIHQFVEREGGKDSEIWMGLDVGESVGTTVLTVVEKIFSRRRVLFVREWRRKPVEEISFEIARLIDNWKGAIVKIDFRPTYFTPEIQKYTKTKLHPVDAVFTKDEQLAQLQRHIKQHTVEIPEHQLNLILQLRKYRKGKRAGDDLVDSLALACYSPKEPIVTKRIVRVIF